jgi:hypothetical protein
MLGFRVHCVGQFRAAGECQQPVGESTAKRHVSTYLAPRFHEDADLLSRRFFMQPFRAWEYGSFSFGISPHRCEWL